MCKWMNVGVLVLALAAGVLGGCGNSVELRLQRAKIALSSGKPDQALEMAESVLKEKADHPEALQYKARAQMQLLKLAQARKTIDTLVTAHSDSVEGHKLLAEWVFASLSNLLRQSDFLTNPKTQTQFDETLALGGREAGWVEQHEKGGAEGLYLRARLAEADSVRLGTLLRAEREKLAKASVEPGVDTKKFAAAVKSYESLVNARMMDAASFLKSVVEKDPRNFEAAERRTQILTRLESSEEAWSLAQAVAEQKDIPAMLFERLTLAILRMPLDAHPTAERLALGLKLQAAVSAAGKEQPVWKITRARLHMLAKEYDKAGPLLDEVIKSMPRDVDARYLKGQVLYEQGKFTEAKAALDKLAEEQRGSAPIQLLYGMTLWKAGDSGAARDHLHDAAMLDPTDPRPRAALVAILAEKGRLSDAESEIEDNYQKHPADPQAIQLKLNYHQAQAQREAVEQLMGGVEKLSPLLDEHLRLLVEGYSYLRKYDRAEPHAQELVKRRPNLLDSHLRLAEVRLMLGKDDQAKQMLTDLKAKFPSATSVDQMLGKLYLQRGAYDRANELLRGVIEKDAGNVEARLMYARALASLSLVDDAIEQLNKVLEVSTNDIRARAMLASVYQLMGQPEQVALQLSKIDEKKVDERTSPGLLAQLKLRVGDSDAAVAICNRAVAAGDPDPMLRLILADIYSKKKNFSGAETNLLAIVRNQPGNIQAWSLVTRFYIEQKQIERGLTQMVGLQGLADPAAEPMARVAQASMLAVSGKQDEALRRVVPILDPLIKQRNRLAMMIADTVAQIHLQSKDRAAAAAVYDAFKAADFMTAQASLRQLDITAPLDTPEQRIAKLDAISAKLTPEQSQLRFDAMTRYARSGRLDRSLILLDQWIANKPGNATLLLWKGDVLSKLNRTSEAVEVLQQATKVAPDSLEVRRALAKGHIANADFPAAEAVLMEMAKIDLGGRIAALSMLGNMYETIGLHRRAAATFEELERTGDAHDPRLIFAIGQSYAALGRDDRAAQRLAEVPSYAPGYPGAQILIARIEQRQGKVAQAKARLEKLTMNPQTAAAASTEILRLDLSKAQAQELMAWSDQALNVENLSDPLRRGWLRIRVSLAANRGDWKGLLEALAALSRIEPDNMQYAALRAVVLTRLNRPSEAVPYLASIGKMGSTPLLALALDQPVAPAAMPKTGLVGYTAAMMRGDMAAARSATEGVRPMRAIYRTDLITLLDRPDATSPEMTSAFRSLGLALVAEEAGLPPLTEDLCRDIIGRLPFFAPAYGLLAQSMLAQGKPVDKVLFQARESLPTSTLALFLSARQKAADKDFAGAVTDLQTLLEREPGNSHVRYDLTQFLQSNNQTDKAIQELSKLNVEGGDYRIAAANDMAYLLADNYPDRRDEAAKIAYSLVKEQPNFAALQDTVGWIEHLQGHDAEALKYLNRAVQQLADQPDIQYHLGMAYKGAGNPTWSKYHLTEAAAAPAGTPVLPKAKAALGQE